MGYHESTLIDQKHPWEPAKKKPCTHYGIPCDAGTEGNCVCRKRFYTGKPMTTHQLGRHYNGLTPAEDERLTLLAEECAEVIVAIAKIQRHGYESFDPTIEIPEDMRPETNRQALTREMGDVRAA